jgi:hypothetical protein
LSVLVKRPWWGLVEGENLVDSHSSSPDPRSSSNKLPEAAAATTSFFFYLPPPFPLPFTPPLPLATVRLPRRSVAFVFDQAASWSVQYRTPVLVSVLTRPNISRISIRVAKTSGSTVFPKLYFPPNWAHVWAAVSWIGTMTPPFRSTSHIASLTRCTDRLKVAVT